MAEITTLYRYEPHNAMKTISIDKVQKSQLTEMKFSKPWFVGLIENLTQDEFELFCPINFNDPVTFKQID